MNCKDNRKELVFKCIYTIALFFCAGCLIIGMVMVFMIGQDYKRSQSKITELQQKVEDMQVNADSNTTASEYEEIISYLETETTKHREFIEDQRQFLIWLVAAIGGVGIVVLGFVGLSNKKDIEEAVSRTVDGFSNEAFDKRLSKILRSNNNIAYLDDKKIGYLIDAVNKQEAIKNTNVVFFTQKDGKTEMDACISALNGICKTTEISADEILEKKNKDEFSELLPKGKCVVVYEVNKNEFIDKKEEKKPVQECTNNDNTQQTGNENVKPVQKCGNGDNTEQTVDQNGEKENKAKEYEYMKVERMCNELGIYCITHTGGDRLKKPLEGKYSAMSNTGGSLLQYIYSFINL